jgi:hypothetical protein
LNTPTSSIQAFSHDFHSTAVVVSVGSTQEPRKVVIRSSGQMADNDIDEDEDNDLLLIESKKKNIQSLSVNEKMEKLLNMVEEMNTKNNETNAMISELTNALETRMVEKIEGLKADYQEAIENKIKSTDEQQKIK